MVVTLRHVLFREVALLLLIFNVLLSLQLFLSPLRLLLLLILLLFILHLLLPQAVLLPLMLHLYYFYYYSAINGFSSITNRNSIALYYTCNNVSTSNTSISTEITGYCINNEISLLISLFLS